MSLVRIWYRLDGEVSVSHPDQRVEKKPEDMTFDEWAISQFNVIPQKAPQFNGLLFDDVEVSTIPQDRADRDKWRGSQGQGVMIDDNVITLRSKKAADIAALGTRAELLAEIDAMVGASPQVIAMMKKLAEIIYSNEKGTID